MTQHRVLLIGAAGQVGQALQYYSTRPGFPDNWDLILSSRTECNITDPSRLRESIQSLDPALVINAAGMTDVDAAEKDQELAAATNFRAVAQMAAQCSTLDIPLIHLSTDYVFDGTKGSPYLPDDQMNPVNYYGMSKMLGEEAIRQELAWHVILRISSVFSVFRRNMLTKTLAMIDEKDELRVVTDLISTPTDALEVAKAVAVIGQELLAGKADGYGTFHLCGTPVASRYDYVEATIEAYAPHSKRRPQLFPALCADFAAFVKRPLNSSLDCKKIEDVYGIKQKPWKDSTKEAIDLLVNADLKP